MTAPSAPLGETLRDRYTIERELGRGGMATVYLATDLKLQRQVALKVLRPELGAALGPDRFLREIQIAARLTHPHILGLHDSGEAGGRLFYAMPYVEGESLRQRLEREGQLPVAEVIAIVQAVASALSYAHQQGIVHRDIKPENILMARSAGGGPPHPLVADFGIARALDAAGGERLTETGLALGTPAYMSPEQASAERRLDRRSDIYSLGCVAYEMLAGQPPFTGPTAQSILARHAVDPVPPLHTVRSSVPPPVEAAIERALAKVSADRFETADQFAQALTSRQGAAPPRSRRARRRAVLMLGGILGAATAGLGGMMLRGSAQPVVSPAAASMAVLPFVAPNADTGLTRLGKDLAVTLSASLDGVGGIKMTDRLSVANATADKSSLSPAEGAALARRLGASSVLRGTLVGAGKNIRLDLGLYSTEGLAPLAEGITVTGPRDSIGGLTDSVSWALLRQIWQRGEPPSPSLADVTTRSLPALRAFLEGERELDASQWDKAALAFQRAIVTDSGFGLAYFRYALTQFWKDEALTPELIAALHRYRSALSERERMLLDAFLTTGQGEHTTRLQFNRLREVTQRFPDYAPGWFLYADQLFHVGPIMGSEWAERVAGFRRVLALNPKLTPAWEHLSLLAMGQDLSLRTEALGRLAELGWPPPKDRVLNLLIRLDTVVFRTGGLIPSGLGAVADSIAQYIASGDDEGFALTVGPLVLLVQGFPAAQIDLNRRALKLTRTSPRVATALRAANAWAWVARGQWDSGLTTLSEISTAEPVDLGSTVLPLENYGMAVLGAWLGMTAPGLADQRRPPAVTAITRIRDSLEQRASWARLAWLDGLLGFARRDRKAIGIARQEAARSGWYQVDLVDGSLAAFDHALAGDRNRAGRELAELDEKCIERPTCTYFTPSIGVQRFAAGSWLQEAGDLEQAARLLRWNENSWPSWRWTSTFALDALAYLARARIEDARGRDSLAQAYYRQFLRRYDRPMPSQVGLVEEAKAAVARLDAGGGREIRP
jgi:tetratricopeptide (TPR) repeat protein